MIGWSLRIAGVSLATLVAGLGAAWLAASPDTPDAFYAGPAHVPTEPGVLVRHEAFTRAVPAGARAWRILYTTTRADGTPTLASGLVMAATDRPGDARPVIARPVIAWAHGTTGIVPGCAPSMIAEPFALVPALDALLAAGWVYVATDYAGLGTAGPHGYFVGEAEARAVLDAVRAARAIDGLRLDRRTVVWGHSQGGHAALWAGIAAPAYAPDIALDGIAALAPVTDLPGLIEATRASAFGKIVDAYLMRAYEAVYPDIDRQTYLHPGAALAVDDIARRCIVGRADARLSLVETRALPRDGIFARAPTDGPLGAHLAENTPRDPITAPLLIAQAESDAIVPRAVQDGYVTAQCARGQAIDYRVYADRDHLSLLAATSPLPAELIAWTRDRLAGVPAPAGCPGKVP